MSLSWWLLSSALPLASAAQPPPTRPLDRLLDPRLDTTVTGLNQLYCCRHYTVF